MLLYGCNPAPENPKNDGREGLTDNGSYYLYWSSIPTEIPFNEQFTLTVMVHDGDDHSLMLRDRELDLQATMPAHEHGMETTPEILRDENGLYTVNGMLFHMGGEWELDFTISDGNDAEHAYFTVTCCDQ
jgi:hypothetical protein